MIILILLSVFSSILNDYFLDQSLYLYFSNFLISQEVHKQSYPKSHIYNNYLFIKNKETFLLTLLCIMKLVVDLHLSQ